MNYTIKELNIDRASRAILIKAYVSVPTRQAFTNENYWITNGECKPTLSLPIALYRFWVHVRAVVKQLQSEPGDFSLEPTDFTKGILRWR